MTDPTYPMILLSGKKNLIDPSICEDLKYFSELPALVTHIAHLIVNKYSSFQVDILNGSTDIAKFQSFLHNDTDRDAA